MKKRIRTQYAAMVGAWLLPAMVLHAQTPKLYQIDAAVPAKKIYGGHLQLGGHNPQGDSIGVNNYYLTLNGKPVIPVTGEFHFSRYPQPHWEESILKMKAGGITVIATYVFWNFHETKEGQFNWSGNNNLRQFIELCAKHNMYVIVRVGPFCHGEVRNGGLPDWLLGRPLVIRSNDKLYLDYVDRFYQQTGAQLQQLYYKDGGPVIGIQIENEYQHSAAPWGLTYPGQPLDLTAAERDLKGTQEGVGVAKENNPYAALGQDHMKILKSLAVKHGMVTPLYTATGWGNAAIIPGETIPVTAAYAYPFWTPKRDYSPFFLYKDMQVKPDYAPVRYRPEDYPVFAAELGSGIMSVYKRRPIADHKSFDAMINRCLGSGANGIGYYMYHGGLTPKGGEAFLSDEAYGLPKISYDFQAPIGEYGQVREGFHRLKLLHFFMQQFGDILAPMTTVLPDNAATLQPDNITDLRYAVRVKDNSGFLFINNFQDDTSMLDQRNIQFAIQTAAGAIKIPATHGMDVPGGENLVLPFRLDMNGLLLHYSTAQLLCKVENNGVPAYVFFAPDQVQAELAWDAGAQISGLSGATLMRSGGKAIVTCKGAIATFTVQEHGRKTQVLVLRKSLALQSYLITLNGKKHLALSQAILLQNGKQLACLSDSAVFDIYLYPGIAVKPGTAQAVTPQNKWHPFTGWQVTNTPVSLPVQAREVSSRKWAVTLPQSLPQQLNDCYLVVDYTGDTGQGFVNGELVIDEFYKGIPWQIGLRDLVAATGKPEEMVLYFRPMMKDASYQVDLQPLPGSIPDFGKDKSYLKVKSLSMKAQYKTMLNF
ncbi:Beta-galactosidase, domain 2 [Filimonas lacunae]|uniref:Beta-galactosidase n=1 Tax=Filimonas lacunae TaxID=477680 RepID=A0A173MGW5_9BACT|nr:beta-galactosidase [Filimonas lacunae]BAV06671.1 beta-galactosidase [Filimonas lacunae]SIT27846.1 Beta-galactosidase, domain 2 [Filimonas lacunae]